MTDILETLREDRAKRIQRGKPLRAPASCRHCIDETDCECVAICRAIARNVYAEEMLGDTPNKKARHGEPGGL